MSDYEHIGCVCCRCTNARIVDAVKAANKKHEEEKKLWVADIDRLRKEIQRRRLDQQKQAARLEQWMELANKNSIELQNLRNNIQKALRSYE